MYGLGAWIIVSQGFSIIWVIVYQAVVLYIFFIVAHLYIPKNELNNNTNKETRTELTKSGKKMVLTSFSSALISELDIVLLGLFYSGSLLGILAWSRRILEIIFQLLAASLDIIFPELSKLKILGLSIVQILFETLAFSASILFFIKLFFEIIFIETSIK